jgi:hypothetical protein
MKLNAFEPFKSFNSLDHYPPNLAYTKNEAKLKKVLPYPIHP